MKRAMLAMMMGLAVTSAGAEQASCPYFNGEKGDAWKAKLNGVSESVWGLLSASAVKGGAGLDQESWELYLDRGEKCRLLEAWREKAVQAGVTEVSKPTAQSKPAAPSESDQKTWGRRVRTVEEGVKREIAQMGAPSGDFVVSLYQPGADGVPAATGSPLADPVPAPVEELVQKSSETVPSQSRRNCGWRRDACW